MQLVSRGTLEVVGIRRMTCVGRVSLLFGAVGQCSTWNIIVEQSRFAASRLSYTFEADRVSDPVTPKRATPLSYCACAPFRSGSARRLGRSPGAGPEDWKCSTWND